MEQTLGKRISANRKRLGLTQEQLAEKLGVTAQAVSKWENDQSCPDISTLPQLAEVFGISTDALLGRAEPEAIVHEAQVVEEDEPNGFHIQNDKWDFRWDSGKRGAVRIAVLVIAVGILYLLAQVLHWDVNFWEILWPTGLLVFGLFGVFHKFSFGSLGFVLVGGYFLADNLLPHGLDFDGGLVFALIVVLFGISLLVDALRKSRKAGVTFRVKNNDPNKQKSSFAQGEDSFDFSASFGESTQYVDLPALRRGSMHTSFGEYHIDLSGVEQVSDKCCLEAHCSFGELVLLVPRKFLVKPDSATAFASLEIENQPDEQTVGVIHLDAHVSFGQLVIRYI